MRTRAIVSAPIHYVRFSNLDDRPTHCNHKCLGFSKKLLTSILMVTPHQMARYWLRIVLKCVFVSTMKKENIIKLRFGWLIILTLYTVSNVCWQIIVGNYRNVISLSDTDPLTCQRRMIRSENISIMKFQFQLEQINSNWMSPAFLYSTQCKPRTNALPAVTCCVRNQANYIFHSGTKLNFYSFHRWHNGLQFEWTLNEVHSKSGKLAKALTFSMAISVDAVSTIPRPETHSISSNCFVEVTLPYHGFMLRWYVHFVLSTMCSSPIKNGSKYVRSKHHENTSEHLSVDD